MLTVTLAARDRLTWKLAHKHAADDVSMRFTRQAGGWKLSLDHAGPADTAITHEGRNVLLLDKTVALAMKDKKLDVRNTDAGPRLTLR